MPNFIRLLLVFTFFFVSNIPFAHAQEETTASTRAELWKQKREQKKSELTPFRPSKMERRFVGREKKGFHEPLGVRFGDIYITQGGITTGAGYLAATVRYFRPNLFDTPLDISASAGYSWRGYSSLGFQFGNILRKTPESFLRFSGVGGLSQFEKTRQTEGDFYYYIELNREHYPQEDFFGIGNDSLEENRTDYTFDANAYDGVVGMRFGPYIGAFVRGGLLEPDISRGTDDAYPATQVLFDDVTAPGLAEQPDFLRLGASLFLDYRDIYGNPTNGGMYNVAYAHFEDQDEGLYDFNRFAVDLRQYIPLGSEQRILAARWYSSFDDPAVAARVPFYLMQSIGGHDSVRGYSEFRFRDRNVFFLSTEYRWLPHPFWEFALFYDTGKVFPDRSDFDFNDLKSGYGVGVRLKSTEDTFLRFDLAHSEEGLHFYFKMNASF